MLFLKETWTSNMRTTTTMTLSRLSQRNQFPTRSASQFPRLSRNITSVFVCLRPCTVLSVHHEDGITVLPPMFETCGAKNLSWNLASGHSETKTASFRPCVWFFVDDFMLACSDSPFGKHVFDSTNNLYECGTWSHECSHSAANESHKPTTNTPEHGADLRSVSQSTRKKFRSSTCQHIDAETENPKSRHLSCLNFEP